MTSALITRFEKLIKMHAPQWLTTLSPGATTDEIDAYRTTFPNPTIPGVDTWLDLLCWHNGTTDYGCLWQGHELLSMDSSISLKRMMDGLEADGTFDRWAPNEWWNPAWVPIFDNRSYDTYAIDTEGCFGGQPGQIVSWSKDSAWRQAVAPSFDAWLNAFCDCIENKSLVWNEDEGGFHNPSYTLVDELLEGRFEGFPLSAEARTRRSIGMVRTPKKPTNITKTPGTSIELVSQCWAPEEQSIQSVTWCGEHGVLIGQNAFNDAVIPAFSMVNPYTGEIQQAVHPPGEGGMLSSWLPERNLVAYLINGAGREIWTYNLETKQRTALLTGLWETRMHDTFDAAGQYILHAGEHVRLFDLANDGAISIIPVEPNDNICAAISHDGKRVAVHSPNQPIQYFETDTLELIDEFKVETESFSKLQFSPDDTRLFGIGYYGRTFEQWTIEGQPIPVSDKPYTPFVLTIEGSFYATAGYTGQVEVRNNQGQIIYTDNAHQHSRIYALTIDPMHNTIISGGDDGQLAVRQIHTLETS